MLTKNKTQTTQKISYMIIIHIIIIMYSLLYSLKFTVYYLVAYVIHSTHTHAEAETAAEM